ncbi:MAPEG family protein [Pelagovum pacificum]|uniref:MAPEG family protein n=1 Tax=Pelagovum pacificum TaxID=2588711 RepID=A0A5C5GD00_9RHOB|nr:MAPEG family protein [Pelagovum pacificum]QQA44192.1 MAPEG family protein [Pelagovum pacificum]TNY32685.1 MAPEG family protein [Pelagovum pacificum]
MVEEYFAAYGLSLVGIALYALIGQVLGPMSAVRKGKAGLAPGATPDPDYASADYRLDRSYLSTVEMLAYFAPIVFAAILAGVSPVMVGLLVWISLALRIAAVFVYIRGMGQGYSGLRTNLIVGHSLCTFLLLILTVFAAL